MFVAQDWIVFIVIWWPSRDAMYQSHRHRFSFTYQIENEMPEIGDYVSYFSLFKTLNYFYAAVVDIDTHHNASFQ